ncbi:MAG: glycosyltransferase [Betaproteobacteria bacterium]
MTSTSRNRLCPCGSGNRYKDCCGRLSDAALARDEVPAAVTIARRMNDALMAQQSKDVHRAERIYREVLAIAPDVPDALHMLGVLRFESGDYNEAAKLIVRALDLTGWRFPQFRYNLGLVIARAYRDQGERDRLAARRIPAHASGGKQGARPTVAVVVPCYNHARFVKRAIDSVFSQTYRRIELVVIDDGSRDGSPELIRRVLADSPFPCQIVTRENRGASATINEGIALSSAPFVNILNSDDWFSDDRIELMVNHVVGSGAEWGFSGTALVDDRDRAIDPRYDRRARTLSTIADAASRQATIGFAFLAGNVAISSGNLFFSRSLFERVGAFDALRYNHDWEFGLRALRVAEPVFVPAQTYFYRLHDSNTISDAVGGGGMKEANAILGEFFRWALEEKASDNAVAPTMQNWGMHFVCFCLNSGLAGLFEPEALRGLAAGIDAAGGGGDQRAGASGF